MHNTDRPYHEVISELSNEELVEEIRCAYVVWWRLSPRDRASLESQLVALYAEAQRRKKPLLFQCGYDLFDAERKAARKQANLADTLGSPREAPPA